MSELACVRIIISAGYDRLCFNAAELERRVVDGWETRLCGNFILLVITCTSITSGQYVNNSAVRTGFDKIISCEALNFGGKNKCLNNLVVKKLWFITVLQTQHCTQSTLIMSVFS